MFDPKQQGLKDLIVDIFLLDDPLDGFRYRPLLAYGNDVKFQLEMDNFSDSEVISNIVEASKVHETTFRFFCICGNCEFKQHSLLGHIARSGNEVTIHGQNEFLFALLSKFRIKYTTLELNFS